MVLQSRTTLSDYVTALAWSSDGQTLAASSAAGEVVLWQSDQLAWLQPATEESIDCLSFSCKGQFLAVGGQNGIVKIWQRQLERLNLVATLNNAPVWIDRLAWSPVEPLLAIGVGRQIKLWDGVTKTISHVLNFALSSVLGIAWHPQGQFLVVSGHGGVKIWQRDNWETEPDLLKVPGASLCAAWSGDGKYLASGNFDRTLAVLEWGNPPPWLMGGFPGKVSHIAWSEPKSEQASPWLASACLEAIAVWHFDSTRDTWSSHVLEKHQGFIQALAFQPGTNLLASVADDGCLYLWQNATETRQTITGSAGFSTLAWHPTGQFLAVGGQEGELLIWQQ